MTKSHYKTISVNDLKALMDKDPNLCLIDVREHNEWDEQHIPEAKHIPKDAITDHIENITTDRNKPIYLHCRSGVRSCYAADCLINIGYTDVYSVEGGILEWVRCGYKTV